LGSSGGNGDIVAIADPDRLCAAFFYGVTLGQATLPERIAYAREPSKLPVVLSADEVVRFLEAIPSVKSRTALTMVHAAITARARRRHRSRRTAHSLDWSDRAFDDTARHSNVSPNTHV
jgi:hypothetical protein